MEPNFLETAKKRSGVLIRLLPLVAFAVPFLWLYLLEPATFEAMWKGRTFQLFFIWLIGLELILDWEKLRESRLRKLVSARTVAVAVAMVLPTVYVVASYYWGLNEAITNWAIHSHLTQGLAAEVALPWEQSMPLSIEYLAFAAMFSVMVWLLYGFKGMKVFSVPAFFIFMVGAIYTIDNVFPYGQFAPFQIFVPTTTALAAAILNLMGYSTSISYIQNSEQGTMPQLTAMQGSASATFSIAWPCAGIESFLIFTVVILLFLKRMNSSWKAKIGYFVFGAAVTYLINAFRIVNIFTTGIVYGVRSPQVNEIHLYYGPLYAVIWIVAYPLLILVSQSVWRKIRTRKKAVVKTQSALPNPA
ncbi:MAG: archaeosortase/exosortase family protein [Candidatus Bathyarchaeota archaeon]|nr:archaeosortase/exosortase family protein [Candidatus Bathyarchaeota archaeon]